MKELTKEEVEENVEIGWFVKNGIVKQLVDISTNEIRIVGKLKEERYEERKNNKVPRNSNNPQ